MTKTDYLFLRPGSQNWHIKLQSPTGRIERSLRTPDRRVAEIRSLPLIAEHKANLLARKVGKASLELSCNTQLACEKCGCQNFRICMDVNEETNETSKTLVNNVECAECHALYQVNLIRG